MVIELVLVLAFLGAAAVVIYWDSIITWIRLHRIRQSDVAVLIRDRLADGKGIRVTCKIFEGTPLGQEYCTESWTGSEVDPELDRIFGQSNSVRVGL